jgi:hypothetical protein
MLAARLRRVAAAGIAVSLAACTTVYRAKFTPPDQPKAVEADAPFLKCHMKDGSVYVLEAQWRIDAEAKRIDARGIHYDASRAVVDRATYHLSIDDVVLFETNRPEQFIDEGIVVLAVLTGASLAITPPASATRRPASARARRSTPSTASATRSRPRGSRRASRAPWRRPTWTRCGPRALVGRSSTCG